MSLGSRNPLESGQRFLRNMFNELGSHLVHRRNPLESGQRFLPTST